MLSGALKKLPIMSLFKKKRKESLKSLPDLKCNYSAALHPPETLWPCLTLYVLRPDWPSLEKCLVSFFRLSPSFFMHSMDTPLGPVLTYSSIPSYNNYLSQMVQALWYPDDTDPSVSFFPNVPICKGLSCIDSCCLIINHFLLFLTCSVPFRMAM